MARTHKFRCLLLAASALIVTSCSTLPPIAIAPSEPAASTLLDKKFERAARHYQKFQHEGQVVYCKKEKVITSNILGVSCLTEPQLRQEVASFERWRNPIARPLMPGAGQGGIGG